ncbi:MAG: GntR family transcriptional regulator [Natronohydrobacter sp.]|nr:GntR family transcriptional regulator [Natronohydrobacter sp.]
MPWLSHSTTNDVINQICDRIWLAVVQRTLRPGARLKEEELTEIFGTTRARVRQALSILEQDGLVTIYPNRGACIAEPGVEDAQDAFSARLAIEQRLVTRLCRSASAEDIATLRDHIAQERAAHARGDSEAVIRLSGEFHMLIAKLSGAELLLKILRMLTIRTSLITAMYQTQATQTCGPDEHDRILAAIEARDETRACHEMTHHLEHLETALRLSEAPMPVSGLREALHSMAPKRAT